MLNLSVHIDDHSGCCFGVSNAISKAEAILDRGEELYALGQIVHNDEEMQRLESKGMKTINYEDLLLLKKRKILFRAHGESPHVYELVKKNGNILIDASCPIVLRLQKQIRQSCDNKEKVYIFGRSDHPEIIALMGHADNRAVVFNSLEELMSMHIPEKITLYSQTTKSADQFQAIIQYLKKKGVDVSVHDSICRQVSGRQEQIRIFCAGYDKVLFVAGKHSSNGKVLYDVCKNANPHSYLISSVTELQPQWFRVGDRVGVCGATSTPLWQMMNVKKALENL